MDKEQLKNLLGKLLPVIYKKAEPKIVQGIKKVVPLEGEAENAVIKAIGEPIFGEVEKFTGVDIDGDANVGTFHFQDGSFDLKLDDSKGTGSSSQATS